jgi:hypothetical protein
MKRESVGRFSQETLTTIEVRFGPVSDSRDHLRFDQGVSREAPGHPPPPRSNGEVRGPVRI